MRRHVFAALRLIFMICLATIIVGPVVRSDQDTEPPYTWDHFPPKEASDVSRTSDITFMITDTLSGPCASSIFVTIDGNEAMWNVYPQDPGAKTLLVVCPNMGEFEPNHVLTVTIDAQDWAANAMARDRYHLTTCE